VVAYDRTHDKILPFQTLSTRKRKDVAAESIQVQVCLYAFDMIYCNGQSLVSESLAVRRQHLHQALNHVKGEFHFAEFRDTYVALVIRRVCVCVTDSVGESIITLLVVVHTQT
jgi:DNA ligase-1